jgi:hypothetical protein
MKIQRFLPILLWATLLSAHAQEACISDNPAINTIRQQWDAPRPAGDHKFVGAFQATALALLPKIQAEGLFGTLSIKSRKPMRYFSQYEWAIAAEGDYWLVADSGAWMDVRDGSGQQALEPLTFNHGLRCAGIHKALKFHLKKGSYALIVASEDTDKVKVAAAIAKE